MKCQIWGEGVTTQAGDNLRAASSDWLVNLMLNVTRRSLHIRYPVCTPATRLSKNRGSSMPPAFLDVEIMSARTHTQARWPSKYGAVIRTRWLNDGTMA